MSVVIKTTEMQYRDANGVYHGINAVAEKKIADQEAALDQIIAGAQDAVNQLETQKNTIAQTVASMAQLGTDNTLTTPGMAADAGACGDLKSALMGIKDIMTLPINTIAHFEVGGLDGNNNYYYNTRYRVCTPDDVSFLTDQVMKLTGDFIVDLKTKNGTTYTNERYYPGRTMILRANQVYKILILRATEDQSETATVTEFCSALQVIYKLNEKNEQQDKSIESIGRATTMPVNAIAFFVVGGLDGNSNLYPQTTYRVCTPYDISFPYDVNLSVESGFTVYVREKSGSSYGSDVIYYGGSKIVLEANKIYKMIIRKATETTGVFANVDEFCGAVRVEYGLYLKLTKQEKHFETLLSQDVSCRVIGTYINAGLAGYTPYYPNHNRWSLYPYYTAEYDMYLVVSTGFILLYRGMTNGVYDSSKDVTYNQGSVITISKGEQFAFVIRRVTEDSEEYADFTTFTNAILCYPKTIYDSIVLKSRAGYIKSDTVKFISHQGYSYTSPAGGSKASGYFDSAKLGFDIGECDIVFTSDDVPMCNHDPSITIDGQTIVIAEHTYDELKTYISSLDEVVKNCKMAGIGIVLDHLSSSYTDTQWEAIFDIIALYGMKDVTYWVTGTNDTTISKIKTFDSNPDIIITVSALSDFQSLAGFASEYNETNGRKCYLWGNYTNITETNFKNIAETYPNVPLGVWNVDDVSIIKKYLPYVTHIISNKLSFGMIVSSLS